jgi:Asp-tRNA(Asn)/Glu-tRNA(Gln) amidotransferase A subunit family amidase
MATGVAAVDDLVLRPAHEQAHAIAAGEVGEVELVEATLRRLEVVDAVVRWVVARPR